MILLAVDTATPSGSVAVLAGEEILVERFEHARITHSEHLMPVIDTALAEAGVRLADVEGFAVTTGPGSFTPLRVGIATVKGLALGTGRPAVGINSLEAVAWPLRFAALDLCPVLDARKGQVFAALFRPAAGGAPVRLREDASLRPEELLRSLEGPVLFAGNGLGLYADVLAEGAPPGSLFADRTLWYSRASVVGTLALARLRAGSAADAAALAAHYARPSEAEVNLRGKEGGEQRNR